MKSVFPLCSFNSETSLVTRRRAVVATVGIPALYLAMGSTATAAEVLRIVVATAPGGVPDLMARVIGQQITGDTGRSVVVENKLGTGGTVASVAVRNAPADGNTIMLVEGGSYAVAPHLSKVNPFKDLAPVGLAATAPIFLCVNAQTGISDFEQFVAYAKKNPGMVYGSSGTGSSHHLAMEYLRSQLKLEFTHVPYKGAAQSVLALVAGEVKAAFLGQTTAAPHAATGKLRILGIASAKRNLTLTPNVPTMSEIGGPSLNFPISLGLFAHGGTSARDLIALNKLFGQATSSDNVRNRLAQLGIESSDGGLSPQEYAAMIKREFDFYGDIVKEAKLKAD